MKQYLVNLMRENVDSIFIEDAINGKAYTFGDIHRLALKTAVLFENKKIGENENVVIITDNCMEAVALYFGALYANITVVPINPKTSKAEMAYILESCSIRHIFVTGKVQIEAKISADHCERVTLGLINGVKTDEREPFFNYGEKTHLIMHSSGTTGKPKAIMHSFSNLISNGKLFNETLGIDHSRVFLNILHLTYLGGYYNLLMLPFSVGSRVVLYKQFDLSMIGTLPKLIERYAINTLWLVPAIVSVLVKFDRTNELEKQAIKRNITLGLVGTAPFPKELKESFFRKYQIELFENYGLSETLFISTQSPRKESMHTNSLGHILEGVDVKTAQDGEILVKTPYLMQGYHNQDVDDFMQEGFFETGDIGRIVDKEVIVEDRKKDIIIRGGENISPREIEELIATHPGISEVAVIGIVHEIYGEDVVAVLTFKDIEIAVDKNRIVKEIKEMCDDALSSNKVPSNFIFIDELPRTVTGKINKKKLRDLYGRAD